MNGIDARGCPTTGATPAAARHFEAALTAFQTWRPGAEAALALALQESPDFTMARILRAVPLVCGRDPRQYRLGAAMLGASTDQLDANERERLHLEAVAAAAAGDHEAATLHLDAVLDRWPTDTLALHVANTFDYLMGDMRRMLDRVQAVLPAWSPGMPGYGALLTTQAFALEENGEYEHAERLARAALALDPTDLRSHHVMAHVFEMTDRPSEGLRWMREHAARTEATGGFSVHCWWHVALFHLALSQLAPALALYDRVLRPTPASDISDLIDASALLWRIRLQGGDVRARARALADAWAPRIDDAFCTFSDVHAMLAFVAAGDGPRAERLVNVLAASQSRPTRYGRMSADVGLPACRALLAFGRGDLLRATTLLASLPAIAHRLGGSDAQRDVLHLTLLTAVQRLRRPTRPASPHRILRPQPARPRTSTFALAG